MALRGVVATMPPAIGGGIVKSHRVINGVRYKPGDRLTAAEINAIPVSNRRALVEKGMLDVWRGEDPAVKPAPVPVKPAAEGAPPRHVVQVGFGRHIKFNVIEGHQLNDEPMSKEEAHALAGVPLPDKEADAA